MLIRKLVAAILFLTALVLPARTKAQTGPCSQTATITATLGDPSAIPYYPATLTANLVGLPKPNPPQPTCVTAKGSSIFVPQVGPVSTNSNGQIQVSITVPVNASISPAGTQWQFTAQTSGASPPLGTGPQSCSNTITVTSSTTSVSLSCPSLSNITAGAAIPGGSSGQIQVNGGSVLTATSALYEDNAASPITLYDNLNSLFKGPNPYVDITQYNARAVSAGFQTTASCNGTTTISLAAASSFQNGDGIVIYGCGATSALSTPSAPTVTPSLAAGALQTGQQVNSPAGSTTYSYEIVARDKNGGLTAAGSAGSTSTGQATLGPTQYTVTSAARSNNVVTLTVSTNTIAAAGAVLYFTNSSDATFSGTYLINSVSGGGATIVLRASGLDTRAGASSSSTGGTIYLYPSNHLSWSAVTGAYQYYICWNNGSAYVPIGATRPSETQWDDYGSTFNTGLNLPDFAACNASATNDYLATTIVSGAGTTSITVANAASQTISGQTAKFDNGPNIQAAVNAASGLAQIHIPSTASGTLFISNSHVIFPTSTQILQSGAISLNETWEFTSQVTWKGDFLGASCSAPQFSWSCTKFIQVNAAYPGVEIDSPQSSLSYLGFGSVGAEGELLQLGSDNAGSGGFNWTFDHVSFATNGTTDYQGMAIASYGSQNLHFTHVLFSTTDSQANGFSTVPIFLHKYNGNPPGNLMCDECFFIGRGIAVDQNPAVGSGAPISIQDSYAQAMRAPLLTLTEGNAGSLVHLRNFTNDTSSEALVANLQGNTILSIYDVMTLSSESGSGAPGVVTGNPILNGPLRISGVTAGKYEGQNFNVAPDVSFNLVGNLPTPSTIMINTPVIVIDGASTTDCSTGGGTTRVWCQNTGSSWVPIN